jgi:flagellar motor switch protein FliG
MRNIEPAVLAKALIGSDERIVAKIKKNISERNAAMVDEETQLMAKPTKREISLAREEVVKPLREANEAEELAFVDQEE